MTETLEILKFVFSSGYTYFGTLAIIAVISWGIGNIGTKHYHTHEHDVFD